VSIIVRKAEPGKGSKVSPRFSGEIGVELAVVAVAALSAPLDGEPVGDTVEEAPASLLLTLSGGGDCGVRGTTMRGE